MKCLTKGGTEKCSIDLAEAFISQGYEAHIALQQPIIDLPLHSSINTHHINSSDQKDTQLWLENFNKKYHPNLILTPQLRLDLTLPDKDIFYVLHIVPSERVEGGIITKLKKSSRWRKRLTGKHIITVSQGVEEDVLKKIKAKPASIRTIGNPFDFAKIESLAKEKCSYALPKNYLLYAGRFEQIKRLDRLLNIYSNSKTDLPLVLMGDGDTSSICTTAVELGISERIRIIEWQKNPYPVIAQADALLLTSDSESFSAVLVESLFLETASISTDCIGPKEIMGELLPDYLIPKDHLTQFSEKVSLVINNQQPSIKKQLKEKYDIRAIIHQYQEIIHSQDQTSMPKLKVRR